MQPSKFKYTSGQLHYFCNASQYANGVVKYNRFQAADEDIHSLHCSFFCSQSRVAPLKTVSIPRLELMTAVLAKDIDKIMCRELDIKV